MTSSIHCSFRLGLIGLVIAALTMLACSPAERSDLEDGPDAGRDASVETCDDDDGICTPGCDALDDADCPATCGNGVLEPGETCEGLCPDSCDDHDACTSDVMSGSAAGCDVACAHERIRACVVADGCCPAGCDARTDDDCAPACGNGVTEPGEACDGDCPHVASDCDDGDACTRDALVGQAADCSARCDNARIASCEHADGCCLPGCDAVNDNDCRPICGNGVIEPGETCEGDCPRDPADCEDGDACTVSPVNGSASACNSTCGPPQPLQECRHDDGCCPDGCDQLSDNDCEPCPAGEHPCEQGCCAWDRQIIERGVTDGAASLAFDSWDRANLVYGVIGTSFHYARLQPGGWEILPGPPGFSTGQYFVLKLDDEDRAHVAWWDYNDESLHYAYSVGDGLWSFCTITEVGPYISGYKPIDMVLDRDGHPIVAFIGDHHLRIATLQGSWSIETVDAADYSGYQLDLTMDAQGGLHLVYANLFSQSVYYAYNAGAGWQIEQIGTIGNLTPSVAVALTPEDQPRVAFYSEDGLVVMRPEDGGWALDMVQYCPSCSIDGVDLIVDATGAAHLVYIDEWSDILTYARQAAGRWVQMQLIGQFLAAGHPRIGLDEDGDPALSLTLRDPRQIELMRW